MSHQKSSLGKHLDFLFIDLIILEASFLLAIFLRHGDFAHMSEKWYRLIAVMLPVMHLLCVSMTQSYHGILQRGYLKEFRYVFQNSIIAWTCMVLALFVSKESGDFSRNVMLVGFSISTYFTYIIHVWRKHFLRKRVKSSHRLPKLLFVTKEENAGHIVRHYMRREYNGIEMIGVYIVDRSPSSPTDICGLPVVQTPLHEYLLSNVVDEVMVSWPEETPAKKNLIDDFLKAGVVVYIDIYHMYSHLPNARMDDLGGYAVLTSSVSRISPTAKFIKRLMDIIGSIVGLILCGIACIIVGPMIYKASPGPIFFSQMRVGQNGRKFRMYKFRSMYLDAEERKKELMAQNEMNGGMFKIKNDPRIIGSEKGPGKGIGNFIRKTSIDELPQFWNVLMGDMSLVGTRPPTADEVASYDLHHKIRLSMKPGITGLWQVSGRSDITDFEEVVRLDQEYIENWSLAMDIKLLLKTVAVVFTHDGAS